jgi:hypothetical protein
MQVRPCFVHLIAYKKKMKTEFKMYYKYKYIANLVDLKNLKIYASEILFCSSRHVK